MVKHSAYDFLFEGKNNEYDEKYKDYIEEDGKMEIEENKVIDKKTVAKILAHIEKNYDAPEIEEYLWKLLDKGTDFE